MTPTDRPDSERAAFEALLDECVREGGLGSRVAYHDARNAVLAAFDAARAAAPQAQPDWPDPRTVMTRPEDRERAAFEAWALSGTAPMVTNTHREGYTSPYTALAWQAWQARAALPATVALPALPETKPVYQMECDGSWIDIDEAHYHDHDGSAKRTLYDAAETHEAWLIRQCDRLSADLRWNSAATFDQGARAAINALREQCRAAIEAARAAPGDAP